VHFEEIQVFINVFVTAGRISLHGVSTHKMAMQVVFNL